MTQRAKSLRFPGYSNPAYRGFDGKRCAIGVLIDDDHYDMSLEGRDVGNPRVEGALEASGWPIADPETRVLVINLQITHDEEPADEWPAHLATIGRHRGLEIPASVRATVETKPAPEDSEL